MPAAALEVLQPVQGTDQIRAEIYRLSQPRRAMTQDMPDLVVPVYLNQRLVFDLVAMLNDGIATVTKISESQRDEDTATVAVSGGFGLNRALASLVKVDLSGKATGQTGKAREKATAESRVHTPASLFFVLRNKLQERKLLYQYQTDPLPEPGQFVEFTASLRRNSLLDVLGTLGQLLELAAVFEEPTDQEQKRPGKSRSKHQGHSRQTEAERIGSMLEPLSNSLSAGGTEDLVAGTAHDGRAVLTVERQYLNDPQLSDLVDGTFRVLGKVINVIPTEDTFINLLRKTAWSGVPAEVLDKLMTELGSLEKQGLRVPRMEYRIPGPVIQVLPLSIFS